MNRRINPIQSEKRNPFQEWIVIVECLKADTDSVTDTNSDPVQMIFPEAVRHSDALCHCHRIVEESAAFINPILYCECTLLLSFLDVELSVASNHPEAIEW